MGSIFWLARVAVNGIWSGILEEVSENLLRLGRLVQVLLGVGIRLFRDFGLLQQADWLGRRPGGHLGGQIVEERGLHACGCACAAGAVVVFAAVLLCIVVG